MIHAELIKNLENADLVLCDISRLNPNVFFELGVRTALDRPVAIVRDHYTEIMPFDTSLINCHVYDPRLAPWKLGGEVDKLVDHIEGTRGDRNSLWQYFGITRRASAPLVENSQEAKMDVILAELRALRSQSNAQRAAEFIGETGGESPADRLTAAISQMARSVSARPEISKVGPREVTINLGKYRLSPDLLIRMKTLSEELGVALTITGPTDQVRGAASKREE